MKVLLSIIIAGAVFSVHNNATAETSAGEFEKVAKQSAELGYTGYDVTVCKDTNGKIVAGGLSFWNSALRIYLVKDGIVSPTERISDGKKKSQNFRTLSGLDGQITIYSGNNDSFLTLGNAEMAQVIRCETEVSGLESVGR